MRKWCSGLLAVALVLTAALPALAAAQTVPERVYLPPPPCPHGRGGDGVPGNPPGGRPCRPADVPPDHFAANAIADLVAAGIMKGDPDGNFRPDATLTAGESVTVFLRVLGFVVPVSQEGHWASEAMRMAVQAGLLESTGVTDPDQPMTRAAVAVLIAKALGIKPEYDAAPWPDIQGLDLTTYGYLVALYKAGIFKGYPDGTFKPGRTLTRAEIAILVQRILSQYKR